MTERLEKMVRVGTVEELVPSTKRGGKSHRPFIRSVIESWYPNYPGDMVKVRLSLLSDGNWRCSVWGADDTGMEFDSPDRAECLWRYEAINDGVTREALAAAGFVMA